MHPEVARKFARLVESLSYNTQVDYIHWEPSAPSGEKFKVSLPGGQLVELASRDNDGQYPFLLQVWRQGVLKDTFTSDEFDESESDMYNLYELVQRKVRGADETLDDLLEALPLPPNEKEG